MSTKLWKKGRGKLGPLAPLHGKWVAEPTSPMGPVRVHTNNYARAWQQLSATRSTVGNWLGTGSENV